MNLLLSNRETWLCGRPFSFIIHHIHSFCPLLAVKIGAMFKKSHSSHRMLLIHCSNITVDKCVNRDREYKNFKEKYFMF